jgi:hypothetical protein
VRWRPRLLLDRRSLELAGLIAAAGLLDIALLWGSSAGTTRLADLDKNGTAISALPGALESSPKGG